MWRVLRSNPLNRNFQRKQEHRRSNRLKVHIRKFDISKKCLNYSNGFERFYYVIISRLSQIKIIGRNPSVVSTRLKFFIDSTSGKGNC